MSSAFTHSSSVLPRLLLATAALMLSPALYGQATPGPQPVPLPPPIATPLDTPYPGTVELLVDLSDNTRRIVNVHEVVPTEGKELTLLYPQWIPGDHAPSGPIAKMAGLVVTGQGKRLAWTRDRVDVFAFHIDLPAGVTSVDVDFQYLSPLSAKEGRIEISDEIADLAWSSALLYPAGHFSRDITYAPSIKLPQGWKYATALETASQQGNLVHFKNTTLNTLVDSPLYGGSHFKRLDLSSSADNQVHLNVFGDSEANLAITPEEMESHKKLVAEAAKLYASHHYSHYEFLLLLSDKVGGVGLEHHQSSEDGESSDYFTNWAGVREADLLGHEYTHSWNGKFRRPADLWTPNFSVPMQDDLLWVYEGMTQYWGNVLTARAGMRSLVDTRDMLARTAAEFDISPGRTWRPLVDTTNQETMSNRRPVSWVSWQRPEDYYTEGMLIWLDVDTRIRELSGDKKSLDDFAKLFFGIDNGSYITKTYTLDDVVAALNAVQPYDWSGFLRTHVYDVAPVTPKDGFVRGGYKLTYNDTASDSLKIQEAKPLTLVNFSTSLGFSVGKDGMLGNVWWGSAAYQAGITPDMQLGAINGQSYTPEVLRAAIVAAETNKAPLQLLFKRGDTFQTIPVDYHGGLRYPHLERVAGAPNRLDAILAPSGGPSVVR